MATVACEKCGTSDRYPSGGCKPCAQARHAARKDADNAEVKAWRAAHLKECREYGRKKYRKNPAACLLAVKRWVKRNYEKKLLQSARDTSKVRGWVCNLTIEDIRIPDVCPLLGIQLDRLAEPRSPNLPSIDRIDSRNGYVKGNVWVISWRANRIKSDATPLEIQRMAEGMRVLSNSKHTDLIRRIREMAKALSGFPVEPCPNCNEDGPCEEHDEGVEYNGPLSDRERAA